MGSLKDERDSFLSEAGWAVRCTGSCYWAGEIPVVFGGPCLIQPIGLWAYAGLCPRDSGGVTSEMVLARPEAPSASEANLVFADHYFDVDDAGDYAIKAGKRNLEAAVANWLDYNGLAHNLHIKLWSDCPSFAGLASESALASALAIRLIAYKHKWTPSRTREVTRQIAYANLRDVLSDEIGREWHQLGWFLANMICNYGLSGATVIAAMSRPKPVRHDPTSPNQTQVHERGLIFYLVSRAAKGDTDHYERIYPAEPIHDFKAHINALGKLECSARWIAFGRQATGGFHMSLVYGDAWVSSEELGEHLFAIHSFDPEPIRSVVNRLFPRSEEGREVPWSLAELLHRFPEKAQSHNYSQRVHCHAMCLKTLQIAACVCGTSSERLSELIVQYSRLMKAYGAYSGSANSVKAWILSADNKDLWMKSSWPAAGDLLVYGKKKDLKQMRSRIRELNEAVAKDEQDVEEVHGRSEPVYLHYSTIEKGWFETGDNDPVVDYKSPFRGCLFDSQGDSTGYLLRLELAGKDKRKVVFDGREVKPFRGEQWYLMFLYICAAAISGDGKYVMIEEDLGKGTGKRVSEISVHLSKHCSDLAAFLDVRSPNEVRLTLPPDQIWIDPAHAKFVSCHYQRLHKALGHYRSWVSDRSKRAGQDSEAARETRRQLGLLERSEERVKRALEMLGCNYVAPSVSHDVRLAAERELGVVNEVEAGS